MSKCVGSPKSRNKSPSKAYNRFESVVARSLKLLSLQTPVEKLLHAAGEAHDLSDMSRAATVLAVSAMDAYFTDIFSERLVPFLKNKTPAPKNLAKLLQRAGLDTSVALDLLVMERPYRRVRTLMQAYLARHSTHRAEVIDELFLAYGLKNFCHNVQKRARRKNLLSAVAFLVRRRHNIAHRGDLNAHGKLTTINVDKTKKRIRDLVKFVSSADEILQMQILG